MNKSAVYLDKCPYCGEYVNLKYQDLEYTVVNELGIGIVYVVCPMCYSDVQLHTIEL